MVEPEGKEVGGKKTPFRKVETVFVAGLVAVMLAIVFLPQCSAGFGDTPRAPILIENDVFFTFDNGVNGGGTGTIADPYIIENWAIDASSASGIHIENTTAYFIIRNCLVENGAGYFYGIYLDNVINGTIENNTCENNQDTGIFLESSSYDNLTNNTCPNNGYGIYLDSSSYNNLAGNTCEGNNFGIWLVDSSDNNTLDNNICDNNGFGIWLVSSCNNNTLTNNTCENNTNYGIYLELSSNNTIHHNCLLNNTGNNAFDGSTNYWDNGSEGNWWSDWQSPDADHNGVVDIPRPILGGTNQDNYPLVIGWTIWEMPAIVSAAPEDNLPIVIIMVYSIASCGLIFGVLGKRKRVKENV